MKENQLIKYGITYLYYLTSTKNIPSILFRGIISHKMAANIVHEDFSNSSVQSGRHFKIDMHGRKIKVHDCVPLFFSTHTPMQYVLTVPAYTKSRNAIPKDDLSIIKIDAFRLFKRKMVAYTDGNAASNATKTFTDLKDLDQLDWEQIHSPNKYPQCYEPEWKRKKSSEVLVLNKIAPRYISQLCFYSYEGIRKANEYIENYCHEYSIDSNVFIKYSTKFVVEKGLFTF